MINDKSYNQQKIYLKRYRKNILLIDRLEEKLARLDDRIFKIKSATFGDQPKGGIPISLDELLADKEDLNIRINKLLVRGRKYKKEIEQQIDSLEDVRYAEILEMFFIELKDFEIIADELGYTIRHVIRLYSEAIDILAMSLR